jgi:glycyl-tRNA synthetase
MVLLTMLSTPARAALVGSAVRRATTRGGGLSPASLSIVESGLHTCATGGRSLCSSSGGSSGSRSSNLVMEAAAATVSGDELAALEEQIRAQGNAVRDAKEGGDKAAIDAAVAGLLALKAQLPADHEMLQGGRKAKKAKAKKDQKAAPAAKAEGEGPTMDEVINVCKRRGIIFQSSEVYGGYAGFFDYGPLGVELRNNIKKAWWRDMVHRRDDVVGLDSSIIASPQVWRASGHVDGFSDPMVDCKESKLRYRADQLFWTRAEVDGELLGYVSLLETDNMDALAMEAADKLKRKAKMQGTLTIGELKDYTEATPEEQALIPSPATGEPGSLTAPREFNLMFQTNVGAMSDGSSVAYLRPETAQGIFTNFKNVVSTGRVKVPFGIAQIGKAFRNEITPRNFIFRSREFEQMEIEYFIPPGDDVWGAFHEQWLDTAEQWLLSIGVREELISRDVHPDHKLAHYARACTDLMFKFPFGTQELQGVAARGCYDLTQHGEASGKSMEYYDEVTKERYVPHVIEPSIGVDRLMLAVLCSAYAEDVVGGETRSVLRFHPRLAPIKCAVFPLVKNKPELIAKAEALYQRLQRRYYVTYDTAGAIGRRYRRMDEVGTPYCITVDFETLDDDTVTLRERDSTEQRRMSVPELLEYLEEQIDG